MTFLLVYNKKGRMSLTREGTVLEGIYIWFVLKPHRFLKLNVSVMDKSIQEALFADRGGREGERETVFLSPYDVTYI